MTDEKARLLHEGLSDLSDQLASMAGHMQSAYDVAVKAVDKLREIQSLSVVCNHESEHRTGYYKTKTPGMLAFWCKGCQTEQLIEQSEVE